MSRSLIHITFLFTWLSAEKLTKSWFFVRLKSFVFVVLEKFYLLDRLILSKGQQGVAVGAKDTVSQKKKKKKMHNHPLWTPVHL